MEGHREDVAALEPWIAPDITDLPAVARALAERCPDAAEVAPLRVLGEGFFSLAVLTASGMVFRLGTAPGVLARYRKERRVLPWLARAGLPLAVPAPRWLLEPDRDFPFGALGYPLIAGRTLQPSDVAGPQRAQLVEQIAAFVATLHALSIEEARALGVPDGRSYLRAWYAGDRAITTPALGAILSDAERALVARFWDRFLAAFEAQRYSPVVTHGDIGDENLIVSPTGTHLVSVIDWEHCALGDPLDDMHNLQSFGRDFVLEVAAAYERLGRQLGDDLEQRLERHWQHGAFPPLRRALLRGEPLDAATVHASLRRHRVLPD